MLIIVFFSKTRLLSGVNVWNVSFGEISNLKFEIQELQMKPQNTRNTLKKNPLRRIRSHSGPFKTTFRSFFRSEEVNCLSRAW